MPKEKAPPIVTFRIGNVKAAVWKNEKHFNVTFAKAYKDSGGDYQDTASFSHADLLNVANVAKRAEEFIAKQATEATE